MSARQLRTWNAWYRLKAPLSFRLIPQGLADFLEILKLFSFLISHSSSVHVRQQSVDAVHIELTEKDRGLSKYHQCDGF